MHLFHKYFTLSNSLEGISSSSKQTLDDVRSQQVTHAISAAEFDEGDWADVADGEPMDEDVEISGEGEEIHILLERSGA